MEKSDGIKLLTWPNNQLRKKSEIVTKKDFEKGLQGTVDLMFEALYLGKGVGLAAPQIDINKCIIVYNPTPDDKETQGYMINPVIVEQEGEYESMEGCLSVPGIRAAVKRANKIKVVWQDLEMNSCCAEFEGYLASIIQHECDHLDGILFINRLDEITKIRLEPHLKKIKKMIKARKNKTSNHRASRVQNRLLADILRQKKIRNNRP